MSDWVTTLLCLVEMQFPGARIILFERPELTLHPCGRRRAHRRSLQVSYGSCGCKRKCPLLIRLCESSAPSFQLRQTMGTCGTRVYSITGIYIDLSPMPLPNECEVVAVHWSSLDGTNTSWLLYNYWEKTVCPHLFACTSFANEKQDFVCLYMSKDLNALQTVLQLCQSKNKK